MDEAFTRTLCFLNELKSGDSVHLSEDSAQPVSGKSYTLLPEEVEDEVSDWILSYLSQRKCPHLLALYLTKTVSKLIGSCVEARKEGSLIDVVALRADTMIALQNAVDELSSQPSFEVELQKLIESEKMLPFAASVFAIKNKRRKMEDRHVVIHDLNMLLGLKNAPSNSYYAVFDGHAGVDAANFAAAHLHVNLGKHPDFLSDTPKAIKEAFKETDSHICDKAVKEGVKSGCTAVTALFREKTLYLSWLGDSQALLVKGGSPVPIMAPHRPNRPDERERIERLGGFVCHLGTWRVNGTLAVSRALGDHEFKPHVSGEPEVNVISLTGTEDFLILACDGLWDGLTPEDVAAILYRNLSENSRDSLDTLAEKLVHQSKQQGSDDNITVVVIILRSISDILNDAAKSLHQNINTNNIFSFEAGHCPERPSVLKDIVSFPSLCPESEKCSGNAQLIGSLESTELSELPTPPIDDINHFTEYSVQGHLTEVSKSDVSITDGSGFYEGHQAVCQNSLAKSEAHMDPVGTSEMEGTDLVKLETVPGDHTTEVQPSVEADHAQQSSDAAVDEPDTAVHIASDIVCSAIETAVTYVNMPESSTGRLNPNAEPFVPRECTASNISGTSKITEQNEPSVEPCVDVFTPQNLLNVSTEKAGAESEIKSEDIEAELSQVENFEVTVPESTQEHENVDQPGHQAVDDLGHVCESISSVASEETAAPSVDNEILPGAPVEESFPIEAVQECADSSQENIDIVDVNSCQNEESVPDTNVSLDSNVKIESGSLLSENSADLLANESAKENMATVLCDSVQTEAATEEIQAVAVDLRAVPDGIPEAEGVCEDLDSDSEKDGGWSYMKAGDNPPEEEPVRPQADLIPAKESLDKHAKSGLSRPSKGGAASKMRAAAAATTTVNAGSQLKRSAAPSDKTAVPKHHSPVLKQPSKVASSLTSATSRVTAAATKTSAVRSAVSKTSTVKEITASKSNALSKPPGTLKSTTKSVSTVPKKTAPKQPTAPSAARKVASPSTQRTTGSAPVQRITTSMSVQRTAAPPQKSSPSMLKPVDSVRKHAASPSAHRAAAHSADSPQTQKSTLPSSKLTRTQLPPSGISKAPSSSPCTSEEKSSVSKRQVLAVKKVVETKETKNSVNKQLMKKPAPLSAAPKKAQVSSDARKLHANGIAKESAVSKTKLPAAGAGRTGIHATKANPPQKSGPKRNISNKSNSKTAAVSSKEHDGEEKSESSCRANTGQSTEKFNAESNIKEAEVADRVELGHNGTNLHAELSEQTSRPNDETTEDVMLVPDSITANTQN